MGFLLGIDPTKFRNRLNTEKSLPESFNFDGLENRAYKALFVLVDKLKTFKYDLPLEERSDGLRLNGKFANYRAIHFLIQQYLQLYMYVTQFQEKTQAILITSFEPDYIDIRNAISFIDYTHILTKSRDSEFYNHTVSIQYLIFLAVMLSMGVDLTAFKESLMSILEILATSLGKEA